MLSAFSGNTSRSKKSPFSFKVYRGNSSKSKKTHQQTDQERIDAILDKISASGYESLSGEEKAFLFKKGS